MNPYLQRAGQGVGAGHARSAAANPWNKHSVGVTFRTPPPASCYNRLSVRDPLVGPAAAIAAGILAARYVSFRQTELLTAIGGGFLPDKPLIASTR